MGKARLIDQKIPMTLNETGEDSYYFPALYLRGQTLRKDAKIKKISVEVRIKFVSVSRPFKKFIMRKSISH
tara:strand:- start:563 stop:775 length:213 start_codon:yes stop_codon:yes gene_type:complete